MSEIDGVEDIQTDLKQRICSFRLTDPDVDYRGKLAELAGSTHELADYEVIE